VLRDLSGKWKPAEWAARACRCFHELQADRVVGERNFGGDMVESTVRTHDPNISYKDANAARGKVIRAEPVAALYEQGKVHHVGVFLGLEEQLTTWVPGSKSPDRLDALGWAVHELMVGNKHHQIFV
jgi:phage terminase large subunit-like protein